METKELRLLNKDGINFGDIEKVYGKEEATTIIQEIIEENHVMLNNIRNSEELKRIKEKAGGDIDIGNSIVNFFIECKANNRTMKNLNEELDETFEILNHVTKENTELKSLVNADSENYERLKELNEKNKIIDQQLNPKNKRRKYNLKNFI